MNTEGPGRSAADQPLSVFIRVHPWFEVCMRGLAIALVAVSLGFAGSAAADPPSGPVSEPPPAKVGTCAFASVKQVGARLEGDPTSGSAISYINGLAQVSYEDIPAMDAAHPGDVVRLCLVSVPKHCPPGDDRGKVYRATNQSTGRSWTAPDSEHSCGGA